MSEPGVVPGVPAEQRTRDQRQAAVAAVLAAAYRTGTIEAPDALRIIRHELRRREPNNKLKIAKRSVGAQAVVDAYAARGDIVPKNGSGDTLHADYVFPVTKRHLQDWITEPDWAEGLAHLRTVVCVTAQENYILEQFELRGVVGWGKYEAAGVSFPAPKPGPLLTD